MADHYEVWSYTPGKFRELVARKPEVAPHIVEGKLHSVYFDEYFREIGAKTIVYEKEYVDRDYLEDFAGYYVRCFHPYAHLCARIHFFGMEFGEDDFAKLLRSDEGPLSQENLQREYLGFIVVKPLPRTIFGRTCLRTYPDDCGRRCFPITREYDLNLFGMRLTVNTLAFQEQDRAVAACATSALWSAFQGTGKLFHHSIPSPVEITRAAAKYSPIESRTFPNRGLTSAQMSYAIREVGLEPVFVGAQDSRIFKSTLYAYLRGRIPVLLVIYLCDMAKNPPELMNQKHAVAVTGFSLGTPDPVPYAKTGFRSESSRIDKVYSHDDQVGPFARMECDGLVVTLGGPVDFETLHTSWRGSDGKIGSARAIPDVLLIPVYHKIRIPFGTIEDTVIEFDDLVEALRTNGLTGLNERIRWDIYLCTSNDLKRELIANTNLSSDVRHDLLTRNLPRFLWRATGRVGITPLVDLLFDATDIEQGLFFLRPIEYDQSLGTVIRQVASSPIQSHFQSSPVWRILDWYARN